MSMIGECTKCGKTETRLTDARECEGGCPRPDLFWAILVISVFVALFSALGYVLYEGRQGALATQAYYDRCYRVVGRTLTIAGQTGTVVHFDRRVFTVMFPGPPVTQVQVSSSYVSQIEGPPTETPK